MNTSDDLSDFAAKVVSEVNRFAEVKNERISWHAGSRKDANDAGSHSVGPNPDRQSITNFVDID